MCAGKAPLAALLVVGAVVAAARFIFHRPSLLAIGEPCVDPRAIIIGDVHGMVYELRVH